MAQRKLHVRFDEKPEYIPPRRIHRSDAICIPSEEEKILRKCIADDLELGRAMVIIGEFKLIPPQKIRITVNGTQIKCPCIAVIGRSDTATICLSDRAVSRLHAMLLFGETEVVVCSSLRLQKNMYKRKIWVNVQKCTQCVNETSHVRVKRGVPFKLIIQVGTKEMEYEICYIALS